MESLQELCYYQLADSIHNAPPLLQEMIIGETSERIRENMKDDVKKELITDVRKEAYLSFCEYLPDIIPEIMQDIVSCMEEADHIPRDFRTELAHFPEEIVECAIQTAIAAVHTLEARYLYRTFGVPVTPIFVNSDDESENGWYDQDSES